jgi:hypothetical protein
MQVIYNSVHITNTAKANPTRQLLEVQLLRDLFRNWCHLFQKLLLQIVCAIGG